MWAFDWPLPEKRLSISDWLGGVIFHLNGSRRHTLLLCDFGRSHLLYSKCVNVSFLLLLNGILWALMGSCRAGGGGGGESGLSTVLRISHMGQSVRSPLIRRHTAERANPQQQQHIHGRWSVFYNSMCMNTLITVSLSAAIRQHTPAGCVVWLLLLPVHKQPLSAEISALHLFRNRTRWPLSHSACCAFSFHVSDSQLWFHLRTWRCDKKWFKDPLHHSLLTHNQLFWVWNSGV